MGIYLGFPHLVPADSYLSDEFIHAETLELWGQRGRIYYSSLAQGRMNNREEPGGGCTSKPTS